jgi:sodium/potassium-transporting ATPase subunit alpha
MDGEKDDPKPTGTLPSPDSALDEKDVGPTQNPVTGGEQRIQFTEAARPERTRPAGRDDDFSAFGPPITRRTQSIVSIPQVISKKDKHRRKSEKEQEKKHVNIDEHLMTLPDVAERYKTRINIEKPGESGGLTSQQAEQLLETHGRNILTPPSKRHPFLKFLDCLLSLFNLLLILAGVLEYILLGIDYKDNFQNVRVQDPLLSWRKQTSFSWQMLV